MKLMQSARRIVTLALGFGLALGASSGAARAAETKLGMGLQLYNLDYLGATALGNAYPIQFVRVMFLPSSRISETMRFNARLVIDGFGVAPSGIGSGHLRTSTMDVGSPFYVDWAYASFTPNNQATHFGIMNLSREVRLGSTQASPFDASAFYSLGLSRYGGVGTPPMTSAGALDASANRPGAWLMGTNVALETIDPNSSFCNFPAPALALVHQQKLGSWSLALATQNGTWGALPARAHDPAQAKGLYLPLNFPEATPQHQGYSLAVVENDLGVVRFQGAVRANNQTMATEGIAATSLTVDARQEAWSASLSLAGKQAPLDTLGGYVWAKDLAGFGLGAAVKSNGLALRQASPFAYVSYGPMLRTPALPWLPSFTLSVQQTNGKTGNALAAGYSLETALKLHPDLPAIGLEYSAGKFDPSRPNELLSAGSPVTHQLVGVFTTFAF